MAHSALRRFDMKTLSTPFSNQLLARDIGESSEANGIFSSRIVGSFSPGTRARDESINTRQMLDQLSSREKQVLQLVAEGKANKVTASELCISVKTVEKHRESLMVKLGIRGTAGLTRYAIATGISPCVPYLPLNVSNP